MNRVFTIRVTLGDEAWGPEHQLTQKALVVVPDGTPIDAAYGEVDAQIKRLLVNMMRADLQEQGMVSRHELVREVYEAEREAR